MKNLIKKCMIKVCERKAEKIFKLELEAHNHYADKFEIKMDDQEIKDRLFITNEVFKYFMDEDIKTIYLYIKALNKQIKTSKEKLEEIALAELGDRLTSKTAEEWMQY